MTRKRKPDQHKLIAEAALSHAGKVGWDALSMKDVAKKAKLDIATVTGQFADKWALLRWVLKKLDEDVAAAVRGNLGDGWRDNLFEILMTRFELVEKHRAAFASLPAALAKNPKDAAAFVRPFCKSMAAMLKTAGAPADPLHAAAFGAVYLSLVDAWKKDDTPDLSKTMAAIDRRLGQFEQVAGYIACN